MADGRLRVLFDGTPLLGERTGVGRYTASLSEELASMPDVRARSVAFTLRGWRKLRGVLPHGVEATGIPVSARMMRACWLRSEFPPIELLAGRADVVHGTNFVLPGSARAKGVLTIHDLAFFDYPDELPHGEARLPELVRVSARRADAICTPTSTVADQVAEKLDVDRGKITVTPLGVDPSWFTAMPPTKSLRGKLQLPHRYLLFVGAAGPRKGLRWLAKAHEADPGLPPLVYIGPGKFPLSERTQHTGYLSDVELRSVVAGASALVLPSRDEGFGLPVLEAMACDVPVVCSDVPALREVAGGHAELVRYGDVDGLIAALTTAVADSHSPRASAARRAHAATFTWRRCAELTVAAYRDALG